MSENEKIIAVIQARMGSKRLPGKVLMPLENRTILGWVIERIRLSKTVSELWVATTSCSQDDSIAREAESAGVMVYRGKEDDVLDRYYRVSLLSKPYALVRVTADNPFIFYHFLDIAVKYLYEHDTDYIGFKDIPLGTGVEVFKAEALKKTAGQRLNKSEKEHVTLFMKKRPDLFEIKRLEADEKFQNLQLRLTVDTMDDYMLAKAIIYFLGEKSSNLEEIISLLSRQPWLKYINKDIEQKNP